MQDREEDDKQLLVKVDFAFLIDRPQIDRAIVLDDGRCPSDSSRPVNLVIARVQVLEDEEEKVLIIPIELQQLQQDIKICITQSTTAFTHLGNLGVIDNGTVIVTVVLIDRDGTIDPHGKLVEEVFFMDIQVFVLGRFNNVFGQVFTEDKFLTINIL